MVGRYAENEQIELFLDIGKGQAFRSKRSLGYDEFTAEDEGNGLSDHLRIVND